MFGYHDLPVGIEKEGISLSLEKEGEVLRYKRACGSEHVDKMLLSSIGTLLINPVEPLNKPKGLTTNLLIELGRSLVIEPATTRSIFVTYPIEIGVFLSGHDDFESLDVLTLARQKLTLYGDPRSGIICKYWKSDVYSSIPSLNPLREGVIELSITNTTSQWVNVTKVVFNAYGMKLYYNEALVSMKATMKIMNGNVAETDFTDAPLEEGMEKSVELYTARKLPITSTKFMMEKGL
jgi:hypothetical protein